MKTEVFGGFHQVFEHSTHQLVSQIFNIDLNFRKLQLNQVMSLLGRFAIRLGFEDYKRMEEHPEW